ncbi:phosphotransferase enzyme family protein [Promicromonospora sp. NPDC090134]|uniref:phosphotransferase enzyme family protein n=1 Tax=Promicromonospora sp. NPDC090134 TaxID=3364408 RepID=UPI0037FB1ED4
MNSTDLLQDACAQAGISAKGAELLRDGENQVFRLPGKVIVRINKPGQDQVAHREVFLGRWLNDNGVQAIEPLAVPQPVVAADHPVTFWHELPPRRPGTPQQVAQALKQLHTLPIPDELARHHLAPFVRLHERITGALWLHDTDHDWLLNQLTSLRDQWADRPPGMADAVIHGDAWAGNVVDVDGQGVTLMDLERCTVGPPEWDLTSTACRVTSFGTLSAARYVEYCDAYGFDVTRWSGFELFRDIRELRVTCFAAYVAQSRAELRAGAQLRVDNLRGRNGPRPWRWQPID